MGRSPSRLGGAIVGGGAVGASAHGSQGAPGALDDSKELLPQARITMEEAVKAASGAAQGPAGEVDLEHFRGHLLFNIDFGDKDVRVDATTGEVLGSATDDSHSATMKTRV